MDNTYDFKIPGATIHVSVEADAVEAPVEEVAATQEVEAPVEAPVEDETAPTEAAPAE